MVTNSLGPVRQMFEGGGGGGEKGERITFSKKRKENRGIGVSKHFSIFQRLNIALATQTVEHLDKRTLIGKSL